MTALSTRQRRRRAELARSAAQRTAASSGLRPGERLLQYYCHDAAECDCPAADTYSGVDVIRVGRAGGVDRCLGCGTTWPAKAHRDDGRTARGTRAGWLDDYLRDEAAL